MTDRPHVCPHHCGASFKRKDHLRRHMLNHTEQRHVCGRCGADFARVDLLTRHVRRHERKDAAAGGEGCGRLIKRRKKMFSKTVVEKNHEEQAEQAVSFAEAAVALNSISETTAKLLNDFSEATAVEESPERGVSLDVDPEPELQDKSTVSDGVSLGDSSDFLADFSKPYTTIRDYSWMFENLDDLSIPVTTKDPPSVESSSKRLAAEVSNKYNFESLEQLEQVLPQITEDTRQRILRFVVAETSRHFVTSTFDETSPFFNLDCLQEFLELYFTKVNLTYPIIHCSSFDPQNTHSLLLISMITLGATYSSKEVHRTAVEVHDIVRGSLFGSPHFSATPDLWVLQALLLIEAFGRNKGGMRQHEVSNLFHGVLINILRKSDYLSTTGSAYTPKEDTDPEKYWLEWIQTESKKRLAYFTFLWDVQHATIFGQTLGMSAFEIRLHLPADLNLWNAPTSSEWLKHRQNEGQQKYFLPTLKRYLNCSRDLPSINPLSRVLILHGLMSISWDMQRKEQTSLGLDVDPYAWKYIMAKAYDCWKGDFEKFYSRASRIVANTSSEKFLVKFATTNSALYHCANILLWTNMVTLQIYAGAEHIFGRKVTQQNYEMAQKAVLQWRELIGKTEKAVSHASGLLHEGFVNLDNWEVDGTLHYNWCLYIAALTCWCYFDSGSPRMLVHTKKTDTNTLEYLGDDQFPELPYGRDAMGSFLLLVTSKTPNGYRNLNIDGTCVLQEMVRHFRTARSGVMYEALVVLSNVLARKSGIAV